MGPGKLAMLREVEASIERLKAVDVVRIVTDASDCPAEIHVLSDGSKSPKQLVRDIQSVALALHDLEVDHRMISVVSMPGAGSSGPFNSAPSEPISLNATSIHSSAQRLSVHVALSGLGREGEGTAVGPPDPGSRHRLVATATCQALERLYGVPNTLHLEGVESVSVGGTHVIVVAATAVGPSSAALLTGSAPFPNGLDDEGVVQAVLDATSERLPSIFEINNRGDGEADEPAG